ncbi:MAG: peptidase T, partial [Synergistaceae bacterium]|nr:peptidase T [Synergistaceae bacterium]
NAELRFIIRDHDMTKFESRKKFFVKCVDWLRDKYGAEHFELEMHDQYYNMLEKVKDHMNIIELPVNAMKELGIKPFFTATRGGTDGAALSWRGLITPNIFAGGHNYHGRFEFISVQVMEKATAVILKMIELAGK